MIKKFYNKLKCILQNYLMKYYLDAKIYSKENCILFLKKEPSYKFIEIVVYFIK